MINEETLAVVRSAAQTLTAQEHVLTIANPEFPLAIYANGYNTQAKPDYVGMSDKLVSSVESHFEEANQVEIEPVTEERDSLVKLVTVALSKIQFNAHNVVVPAIKAMAQDYAERQTISSAPDCRVDVFKYDPIHDDPRLVNHVQSRYATVKPQPQYRTFILRPVTASAIIEMVATRNPHLDQEQVTNWLLKMPVDQVEAVWASLFGGDRVINPSQLQYITGGKFPFTVDALALAYCLCGYYIEEPQEVVGESVDIDEWSHTLRLLHEMLGSYLLRAYSRRADDRQAGLLILHAESTRPVENRRVVVTLNGDVAEAWAAEGGDIQAVLGAALENGSAVHVQAIKQRQDYFVQRWLTVYPLIRQAALDHCERARRENVVAAFMNQARSGRLAERQVEDVLGKLKDAMRHVRNEDLKNPFQVFALLVCKVYFPASAYHQFLVTMDEYGQAFPEATGRELATQALITLTAIWIAQQIKLERFIPDVNPNAEVSEELVEPTGAELVEAAEDGIMGEGALAQDVEVEEEAPLA